MQDLELDRYILMHQYGIVLEDEDEDMDISGMPEGYNKEATFIKKELRMKKD